MGKTRSDGSRSAAGLHRTSMLWFDPSDFVIIGLDTNDGPDHYLYDPRIHDAITEQEIANIRTFGVKLPVLVERNGDQWMVVDGRGRVRRAREAAKLQKAAGEEILKVPCVPQRGSEVMMFGVSRVANSCRTADGPLRNAENAQRMISLGMTEVEIGVAFGKSQATIRTWLALLDLAPKVKAAVEKRQITATAAAKLKKLSRAEQEESLEKLTSVGAKPTVERATNAARAAEGKAPVATARERVSSALAILTHLARSGTPTRDTLSSAVDNVCTALSDGPLNSLRSGDA